MDLKQASYDQLIQNVELFLKDSPDPPITLTIPLYYNDPKKSIAAKKQIEHDTSAAYTLALAYMLSNNEAYKNKSIEYIFAWANINVDYTETDDSPYVLLYKGHQFIDAAIILNYNTLLLSSWINRVYLKASYQCGKNNNNKRSWSIYGNILAYTYLNNKEQIQFESSRLKQHIQEQVVISWNPFGKNGELWRENLRNNSGMWYTAFSLSPMLGAAWLLKKYYNIDHTNELILPLNTLFNYCLNPETWSYKKYTGIIGIIQQFLFPSADEVEIPDPGSSPGNIYKFASIIYNKSEWSNWSLSCQPIYCCDIFKYAELFVDWNLI